MPSDAALRRDAMVSPDRRYACKTAINAKPAPPETREEYLFKVLLRELRRPKSPKKKSQRI